LTFSIIKLKNNFEPVPKSLDFVRGIGASRKKGFKWEGSIAPMLAQKLNQGPDYDLDA
jgi:hypothetical protein